ncbi:unnamed protein product [Scytosiphon promiscuus]
MKSAGKPRQAELLVRAGATKQQPSGNHVAGGDDASKKRKQVDVVRSGFPGGSGGGGKARVTVATSHRTTPLSHQGGSGSQQPRSFDRTSSSSAIVGDVSRRKEGRAGSVSSKRPPLRASVAGTAAASASSSNKRVKVDSGHGEGALKTASTRMPVSSKLAKSSGGGAPSFMKPTKTSGARTAPGSDKPAATQAVQRAHE